MRPQSAPCLGNRTLSLVHIDRPLLQALVKRWEHCFVSGHGSDENSSAVSRARNGVRRIEDTGRCRTRTNTTPGGPWRYG